MTEEKQSRQGAEIMTNDPAEMARALRDAFDYRGDVTVTLTDGTAVDGYVSNISRHDEGLAIDLLPADGSPRRRIASSDICSLRFSGRDTADGRSFEAWAARWEAEHGRRHP